MMVTKSTENQEARWYIIHSYSGQEERVKKNLERRIESMDVRGTVLRVVIPTEGEVEIKDGKRKNIQRKVFPGYILVQMYMDEHTWDVVRNTPGVTGFVSAEDETDKRIRPVPLENKEVDSILNQMVSDVPRMRVGYTVGQSVRIVDGPFADFIGTVDTIDSEAGKIRVLVSFFGRDTPVELDFLQVGKL